MKIQSIEGSEAKPDNNLMELPVMRFMIIIVTVLAIPTFAFSTTILVPGDYTNIQDAINAAFNGDIILVSSGVYPENLNFYGKKISVKSVDGPHVTIIDGNSLGHGVVFWSGESPESVLDGFTITNCTGIMGEGGIFCSWYASPTIINNIIVGNHGADKGGGIHCYNKASPLIINNIIAENSADHGGGIYCTDSSPIINSNYIKDNSAFLGGGIICLHSSPLIINSVITLNLATFGAGLFLSDSNSQIMNITISGNKAQHSAGGIDCDDSFPNISNSIIWGNWAGIGPTEIRVDSGSNLTITYSDINGGWSGKGNINFDPLFVDICDGDFHLTFSSPCKDKGDNSSVKTPYDFEGDPRIAYGTVDMGADEFYTHLYWTGDATPGGNVEFKLVGLPGTTPVGLCFGSGDLDPPIPSIWGDWYLLFPIIGPINLGMIPSPDGVLVIPGTIPSSPPAPYSIPMQALIGAELSNLAILEVK